MPVICLLLHPVCSSAQKKISATITDAATGQPLQGATITSLQSGSRTLSDPSGNFHILYSADTIEIRFTGYDTRKIAISDLTSLIALTPSFINLSEIIVSGNREAQKRTEAPLAIDVLSKTQINEAKATRLDMLINKIPGVFMTDLGNEQHSMSIRQPIGYQSVFLYLEDGIPIRTVGDFNHNALIEINQASMQQIEVIKGPSSSLYGSEAVSGAINFITQSPTPYLSGKVQAGINSRGYKRTDVSFSNTYKRLGIFAGAYLAGQQQGEEDHNDFFKNAFTLRSDYTFNDKIKITAVADIIRYQTDQKGGLDSAYFFDKNYTSQQRFTYRKVNALRIRSTVSVKWNEQSHSAFTVFFRNSAIGQNPFYSISNIPDDRYNATGQINRDAFRSVGTVLQHTQKIASLHTKWISGISADYSPATYEAGFIRISKNDKGIYYAYTATDSLLTDYHANLLNTAAYTQIEYHPVKALQVVLAARYDRLDYHFDNHLPPGAYSGAPDATNHFDHFTPKAGLTWNFAGQRGIYINYSVGFAPPNITDLYTGVQVPVLKPSSYRNYEAGGWYTFAGVSGYAEASFYYMQGKNEIVSVRQSDGLYRNENAGATLHRGIEASVRYALSRQLNFRIGGTVAKHNYVHYLLQGNDYSGNKMALAPSYIANAELTYRPAFLKGYRIAAEYEGMGAYYTDPQNTMKYKGFRDFNIRMAYKIKRIEIWLNCTNIMNTNYAVTVEKSAYGTSYRPAQLRTFYTGIAWYIGKI